MVNSTHIRSSKEMIRLINDIEIEYLKRGKRPPNRSTITKMIATKTKKEDILFNEFIPFK